MRRRAQALFDAEGGSTRRPDMGPLFDFLFSPHGLRNPLPEDDVVGDKWWKSCKVVLQELRSRYLHFMPTPIAKRNAFACRCTVMLPVILDDGGAF